MQTLRISDAAVPRTKSRSFYAGWTLSGLAILFLSLDGAMKLAQLPPVVEASTQLGWPSDSATLLLLAFLLLGSTLLYAVPRTAVFGAVLLTAYLGGAVSTHVRIGSPLFSHTLFGVYIGIVVWAGLWLRDSRIRALLPLDSRWTTDPFGGRPEGEA